MTRAGADNWIVASAVVTAGVYGYLRYRGANQTDMQTFATAWGVVYVMLSVMAMAAPGVAAGFATLVMTADLLGNGQALAAEVAKAEGTDKGNVK